MARRRTAQQPERQPANLSAPRVKEAVPKVERRLRELEEVDFGNLEPDLTNRLDGLYRKVDGTLVDVFGADSLDYRRHKIAIPMGHGYSEAEKAPYYREAVNRATSKLRTVLEVLHEQLEDAGETTGGRALRAYDGLGLHEHIDRASGELYRH